MPIIQVLLEVPAEIQEGLASGRYVRDAAGIIRWAKGTDNAGEIYAHLREISETGWQAPQAVGPNLLLPMGAMMAIQIAGFAYLGYQLKQIREAIEVLGKEMTRILDHVEIIRQEVYLQPLSRVAHGIEHLMDAAYRPPLLDEARSSFREARGEINTFFRRQESMALVEFMPQTEQLLKGLCVSFAGEYVCMNRQRSEFDEIRHVCGRYANIISETRQKLSFAPPINKILPSSRYLANFPRLRPVQQELTEVHQQLLAESEFIWALKGIELVRVEALSMRLPSEEGGAVMVVYP